MKTIQSELNKYRHFLSTHRLFTPELTQGENMQTQEQSKPVTRASNTRYKRTSEELDNDIRKVDELVASGKYNQIEALKKVDLQSSVYHYRKKQWKQQPAKSAKPRKFAHRTRSSSKQDFSERKQELLTKLEKPVEKQSHDDFKLKTLQQELILLREKYNKLKEYVVENVILG